MNKIKFSLSLSLVLAISLMGVGCSQSVKRPQVVPVTGAIAYNGNPIAGASVAFYVEGSPRAATGTTDAKGEFKLSTYAINDGCAPGVATITVTKAPEASPATATTSPQKMDPLANAKMFEERSKKKSNDKPLIPLKYSETRLTPLKETIKASGENRFVIQLKD